jgi:predicted DNA binding CopG/RHH family protein
MLWNGNECGKNQGKENLKGTTSSGDYDRSEQVKNVQYLNKFNSIITNDASCTREIKLRIAMGKAAFVRKKILFTGIKFQEKTSQVLHLEHSFVWC